jgi:hypothetical protein
LLSSLLGKISFEEFVIVLSISQAFLLSFFCLFFFYYRKTQSACIYLAIFVVFVQFYMGTQLFKQFAASLFLFLTFTSSGKKQSFIFLIISLMLHWSSVFVFVFVFVFRKFKLSNLFVIFSILLFVVSSFISVSYYPLSVEWIYRLNNLFFIVVAFMVVFFRKIKFNSFLSEWGSVFFASMLGFSLFSLFLPIGSRSFLIFSHVLLGIFVYNVVSSFRFGSVRFLPVFAIVYSVYPLFNWFPFRQSSVLWKTFSWSLFF